MKKLLYLLILLSQGSKIQGQIMSQTTPVKRTNALSLGAGISFNRLKNETSSPLIFSGVGIPIHLTYGRESAVSKQQIQLLYQSSTLKSPFDFELDEQGGHLMYGYLRKVKSFNKMTLLLGGEVHTQGAFWDAPKEGNNTSGMLMHLVNLSSELDYTVGQHRIEAQLSIAVLGVSHLRPMNNGGKSFGQFSEGNYLTALLRNTQLETLPDYLNTTLRLGYTPILRGQRFQWRVDYCGHFYRFKQRQFFGVLQHQLTTSLSFIF
jgi:hypothetical protein